MRAALRLSLLAAGVAGTLMLTAQTAAPDPQIQAMVATWPGRIAAARAAGLGLHPDPDFPAIIRAYLSEQNPGPA